MGQRRGSFSSALPSSSALSDPSSNTSPIDSWPARASRIVKPPVVQPEDRWTLDPRQPEHGGSRKETLAPQVHRIAWPVRPASVDAPLTLHLLPEQLARTANSKTVPTSRHAQAGRIHDQFLKPRVAHQMSFHLRGVSTQIENRTHTFDDAKQSTRVRKLNLKIERIFLRRWLDRDRTAHSIQRDVAPILFGRDDLNTGNRASCQKLNQRRPIEWRTIVQPEVILPLRLDLALHPRPAAELGRRSSIQCLESRA